MRFGELQSHLCAWEGDGVGPLGNYVKAHGKSGSDCWQPKWLQSGQILPDRFEPSYDGITVLVDKGRTTDKISLDLCRAFDTVLRDIPVSKVDRYGFNRWTTQWVRNWMKTCTHRIVKGLMSKCRAVMTGIHQESVSGLVLDVF